MFKKVLCYNINMDTIKAKAYAKLNLSLEILGQRPDGYHDICSVFHAVTLADELEFTLRGDGRIVLDANEPHLPTDERNLAVKAALLLKQEYRIDQKCGVTVNLRKQIPVGAGLGGGSSDAACSLLSLNRLWNNNKASVEELSSLGSQIGSDVPFFLAATTALVKGRGEVIEPLAVTQRYHFVIIYPGFGVSTAWAYKTFKKELTNGREYSKILASHCLNGEPPDRLAPLFHNDFEPTVIKAHPRIAEAKSDLLAAGALGALMSGSGSSVFGIFSGPDASLSGWRRVQAKWPRSFTAASVPDTSE